MATKSIGISEATAQDLAREANKHKVSRDKVISKMLDFFRIYGIDPFNYDAPADEMQKIIKRMDSVVAFIKKQEKDILIPTLTRLTTKEDLVKQSEKNLSHTNELLRLLRDEFATVLEENKSLKAQLDEAKEEREKQSSIIYQGVTRDVSRMLQTIVGDMKGLSIKDKDKAGVLRTLETYER